MASTASTSTCARSPDPRTEDENVAAEQERHHLRRRCSIGTAVAHTFAREGAKVFLAGRTRENLDRVAKEIEAAGGSADVAVIDALDERAVDEHAGAVADRAGSVDVSFNLITRGDVQGIPLAQMSTADLTRPITTGITTTFITARAAARHMITQGSGVILALNSGSAHGSPMMGGTGPADAATDSLIRNLAIELGPQGIRVLASGRPASRRRCPGRRSRRSAAP